MNCFRLLVVTVCLNYHSASYAALTVFNDLNQFLNATGLSTADGFEDLSTGIVADSFDRTGYVLRSLEPNTSDFNTNSGGTVVGNVRIGYSSSVPRSRYVFDFDSPITAFAALLIDAPEDPDSTGNFDLVFFNDEGESLVALTGPVASESSTFFGVVKTDGVMQQVGFELPGASDGFAIDEVYSDVTVIPEPNSLALVALTMVSLFMKGRKLRSK